MDQTTPPQIHPELSTRSTITVQDVEKTKLLLTKSDSFLAQQENVSTDSRKLLDNIENSFIPFEQNLIEKKKQLTEELCSLNFKCKQLNDRLKTLEQKVEKQNKSLAELKQQIDQNKTANKTAITDLKKEYERIHTSCSFKIYTGGGIAALLFIYLWYVAHK